MEDKYYVNIKQCLINNEIYKKVKDYSKNKSDLITYYNVGKELSEAGKHYGEGIIKKYSINLTHDLGKGYNETNLKRFRKFYIVIEKGATMWHQLSWSHYRLLITLEDINIINYYSSLCVKQCLSVRELQNSINLKEYERLPIETKNKLISEEKLEVKDLAPNPILIKNKNNIEIATERALHDLILENIESFMKELGNNFSFIGSEYKIKIGDTYHKIDLLFFNVKYNAYVVVELKVTKFKVEYISQVQKYMNYIDKNVKEMSNNNTIGILICKKEDKFVIEYCSDERIAVREYEFV